MAVLLHIDPTHMFYIERIWLRGYWERSYYTVMLPNYYCQWVRI